MNRDWHAKNRTPRSATMAQRVRWHQEHARACGCRPVPTSVQAAMQKSQAGSPSPERRT